MKFFISELFTAADIRLVDILRIVVAGAVCITAIAKCGIYAVLIIAMVYIFRAGIEV